MQTIEFPDDFRRFRHPAYCNAFEPSLCPGAANLYCTESLFDGGYDAEVLLLAKDACKDSVIRERVGAPYLEGDGAWRPGGAKPYDKEGRQTNDRMLELGGQLPYSKLYGSIMANLLRNDNQTSGKLTLDEVLLEYVEQVLTLVIDTMSRSSLRLVVCVGEDSWDMTRVMRRLDTPRRPELGRLFSGPDGLLYTRVYHPARWPKGREFNLALWKGIANSLRSHLE